jgi:hypothetical protein
VDSRYAGPVLAVASMNLIIEGLLASGTRV